MNRRNFLKTSGAAVTALTLPQWLSAIEKQDAPKPNIIFILGDDVGLSEISCCGADHYKTPHIDKLAETGTRFEYCYATPLCGPSRCQLLTGQYPFRTGLNTNQSQDAIDPSRQIMMPTVMKKAGYVTGHCGKWGQMALGPAEWGFDEYLVFPGSGRYWRGQTAAYKQNGKAMRLPPDVYLPDLMHDFVVDFIKRHKNGPFYLYYPMSHIHGPIVRTPDSKPGTTDFYPDNVAYMDKLVGKLVEELDGMKLRENTLIVYAGDNGTASFGSSRSTLNGGKPIHGGKNSMTEGGSRVPLIVNWLGTTPVGKVNHDLTDFSDFFVTLAELGGAPLPQGVALDGVSFAPQIKGQKGTPREWAYVELGGESYARDARWKLTNKGQMFDLKNAPFEEIPVPSDTKDADAIAARKSLQAVLDKHPAAPTNKPGREERRKMRQERRARQNMADPSPTPAAGT